jgi:hypothetical protein
MQAMPKWKVDLVLSFKERKKVPINRMIMETKRLPKEK